MLTGLDWAVVAGALGLAFLPVLFVMRRSGRSADEFFASGRSAPWWLVGTSMVATTFSTDTPNLVTDIVRKDGVAGNWVWWAFLLTGMATVFFFARLWRRADVLTDLEFYELRYAGRPAAFLRGFRAVYLGLVFNVFIMATVTLAAVKFANLLLGWERLQTILVCSLLCVAFSAVGGLRGVMLTDLIQFAIAMVGVIAAAWVALDQPQVGGLDGLLEKVDPSTLAILPDFGDWQLALAVFVIPLTVQWWSAWYPGAEPGGGSYIAQRMLAAKDERHAMAATLWFNIAHYALRPWPWIVVALCSLLVFPTLDHIREAFPGLDENLLGHDLAYPAMLSLLPAGLLGLLVASLVSAYVSTMSTHLNWGSSYLVHDLYRRFVNPDAGQARLVWGGRLCTVVLMVASALLTLELSTAQKAFQLLLSIGAGTGALYLLRWFWWRINAWSEVAAMVASLAMAWWQRDSDLPAHTLLLRSVGVTTLAWVVVTLVTPAVDRSSLLAFYRRVRPGGPGWRALAAECPDSAPPDPMVPALLSWLAACLMVYAALFGTGAWLYGRTAPALVCTALFAVSAVWLGRRLARDWRRPAATPE